MNTTPDDDGQDTLFPDLAATSMNVLQEATTTLTVALSATDSLQPGHERDQARRDAILAYRAATGVTP